MKLKKLTLILCTLTMLVSCEEEISYDGYYEMCQRISLEINEPNNAIGYVSSTDFVGHFSDAIYGKYDKNGDTLIIKWDSIATDNTCYNELPLAFDTVIYTNSSDTLEMMHKGEQLRLHRTEHSTFNSIRSIVIYFAILFSPYIISIIGFLVIILVGKVMFNVFSDKL